jgi:hypothetical protein
MLKSNPFVFAKIKNLWSTSRMPERFVAGRERGISLIEGILYLVLAISVIAGGIVLFQNAQLSNRVTDTSRGIVTISSETRALHQNARDFGDVALTNALINSGAVPSNFQDNAGTGIRHPWGGAVIVTGDDQQFTIELQDVPSEACVRLSSVNASGQGVAGIGIASVGFEAASTPASFGGTPGTADVVNAPVTPDVAAIGCGNQSGANVIITYDR